MSFWILGRDFLRGFLCFLVFLWGCWGFQHFFLWGYLAIWFYVRPKTGAKRGGKPLPEYYPCHILRFVFPHAVLRCQNYAAYGLPGTHGGKEWIALRCGWLAIMQLVFQISRSAIRVGWMLFRKMTY
ncbi:hypothetical protein [Moellerella wisconsensis]|nr:hypothetical protein C9446_20485 [Providencia heimbachae]